MKCLLIILFSLNANAITVKEVKAISDNIIVKNQKAALLNANKQILKAAKAGQEEAAIFTIGGQNAKRLCDIYKEKGFELIFGEPQKMSNKGPSDIWICVVAW